MQVVLAPVVVGAIHAALDEREVLFGGVDVRVAARILAS